MSVGMAALAGASSMTRAAVQTAPIITRRIPSSGKVIPVIGLGTWQTFDVGSSAAARAQREEVLSAFIELGGRVIDSSPMYGSSEEVVGDLIAKLGVRSQVFLATKVWTSGKARGIQQMQESMRKLRTRSVDLMQVHNLVDVRTHVSTLREWKRDGRIRYIGMTHYTAGFHDDIARLIELVPVDFIQINYSVAEREAEQRLLPLARERDVAVIANRPFAAGTLLRELSGRPLPDWASEIECTSWAQLLLKFVVSHPAITCAIPATSRVEHLRDNMRAGSRPLPNEELRARIAAAAAV
ncbi:MAG TPA: aldo/keto reductase [Gemmatimonadaceae bacterium]|nr:aldo/keto reductase [Gemmatimonadaceae bacterium]